MQCASWEVELDADIDGRAVWQRTVPERALVEGEALQADPQHCLELTVALVVDDGDATREERFQATEHLLAGVRKTGLFVEQVCS